MLAIALFKNKFDLPSSATFISLQGKKNQVINVNATVEDHGLTFHLVTDYDSKILSDKLDPTTMTVHPYVLFPMILMFIKIMMRWCFRLDLNSNLKKKKFRLLMIIKFSINSSDLQIKKKYTSS
ncbi:hypothetical protein [Elizabethkingia occulta]|uniref:hypothetical protein n=1 Tax=Elizabethkingia occulta TaxID=1867263 RepID=UPI0009992AAD|nr:hypothetical protein [Elizabethkingia occulta]OPB98008.1 hypothetical protein BB020_14395 [Elizabethkingia occulta]